MTRDDLDRQILGQLQHDGRRPFREIARRLGVSERAVRQRVRRLQDDGTLRIFAFVDPHAVGVSVLAMILVKVDGASYEAVVDTVKSWTEVTYISSLIGRHDLYMQVVCKDNDGLAALARRVRGLPGVSNSETMIETAVHKFIYAYPGVEIREDQ